MTGLFPSTSQRHAKKKQCEEKVEDRREAVQNRQVTGRKKTLDIVKSKIIALVQKRMDPKRL